MQPVDETLKQIPGKRVPAAVWLGLTIAVMLDAPMQLLWKSLVAHQAALGANSMLGCAASVIEQPRLWILLLLFAAQFFNWMRVLSLADLSFAQPFTALSYFTVSGGAAWIFHEHLTIFRIVGIGLILGGVALVGSTPHKTVPSAERAA